MVNLALVCTVINLIVFISYIYLFILNKKRREEMLDLNIKVGAGISGIDTRLLAAQAYQLIGEITCDMPDNPQIVRVLDYFSDIANGDALVDFDASLSISAPCEKSPN